MLLIWVTPTNVGMNAKKFRAKENRNYLNADRKYKKVLLTTANDNHNIKCIYSLRLNKISG